MQKKILLLSSVLAIITLIIVIIMMINSGSSEINPNAQLISINKDKNKINQNLSNQSEKISSLKNEISSSKENRSLITNDNNIIPTVATTSKRKFSKEVPHRLWPNAEVLETTGITEKKGKRGHISVTLVKDPDFPHPVRIEEEIAIDPITGEEKIKVISQMMADHVFARFDLSLSKNEIEKLLEKENLKLGKGFKVPGLYTVLLPEVSLHGAPEGIGLLKQKIKKLGYAEPDYLQTISDVPTDPEFDNIWGMNNTGQEYTGYSGLVAADAGRLDKDIDWLETWETGNIPIDNNVLVAVIDTGVDYNHADLSAKMWKNDAELNGTPGVDDDGNGYVDDIYGIDTLNNDSDPWDDHYHGTHCAGTIAAANNSTGIIGVNPYAKIMTLKFLGSNGGSTEGAIECIEYAVEMGAKILSNSWGGGARSQALQDMINFAVIDRGVVFIAAAGNSNTGLAAFPAAMHNVLSVGATNSDDLRASFSNYGINVKIMAPGKDILSCRSSSDAKPSNYPADESLLVISGTSMACPMVSGAMSIMLAQNPGHDPFVYEGAMLSSTDDIDSLNPGYEGELGKGRLNLPNFLAYSASTAFAESHIYYENGGFIPIPGSGDGDPAGITFGIEAKIGTWNQAITNISYHVTNVTAGLNLLTSSFTTIGDLDAYSVYNVSNDTFAIQIKNESEAPWGSIQGFDVEVRQGETVLDTKHFEFKLMSTAITEYTVADFDENGSKEIIGVRQQFIFGFDKNMNLKWNADIPIPHGAETWTDWQLRSGNFDSEPGLEFAVIIQHRSYGNAIVRIYDKDGNFLKDIGDGATDDEIGEGLIDEVWAMSVADVNKDGIDDLIIREEVAGKVFRIIVLNPVDGTEIWHITARKMSNEISRPAVGDIEGDGNLELVYLDYPIEYASADNPTHLIVLNAETGAEISRLVVADYICHLKPILGDLDGDGDLDAFIMGFEDGGNSTDILWGTAFDLKSGEILTGWPIVMPVDKVPPALADLDKDGDLEIIAVDVIENNSKTIKVYHHDGTFMQGFPYRDENIIYQYCSLSVADINADGFPEILYLTESVANEAETNETFGLVAIDKNGLKTQEFPKMITQAFNWRPSVNRYNQVSIVPLDPVYDGETLINDGNAYILANSGEGLNIIDTGYLYNANASDWATREHDWDLTAAHKYASDDLQGRFASDIITGYGNTEINLHSTITGLNKENLTYEWYILGEGETFATSANPTHTFNYTGDGTNPQKISVKLIVTNGSGGESWEFIKNDFLTLYPPTGISTDFTVDRATGIYPHTVHFSDASTNGALYWEWDFDNDGIIDSFEQNPAWTYFKTGNYSIKLRAYNNMGGDDILTKTNFITVTGANLYVSTDAATWEANPTANSDLRSVAYGNGKFVAVGYNGAILESPDGDTWSSNNSTGGMNDIVWISYNGFALAVGEDGRMFKTVDGTSHTSLTSGISEILNAVSDNGSLMVVVGNGGTIITSTDGALWSSQTSNTSENLNDITCMGSTFIAVGNNGMILTSVDGTVWNTQTSGITEDLYTISDREAEIDPVVEAKVVAGGENGVIVSSLDGGTWISVESGLGSNLYGSVYGKTKFYFTGATGGCIFSTDGDEWSILSENLGEYDYYTVGFDYSEERFFLGGDREAIVYDDSGWTVKEEMYHRTKQSVRAITDTGSCLLSIGNGGALMKSTTITDAFENVYYIWDAYSSGDFNSVYYENNKYYITGDFGTLLSSSDVITWNAENINYIWNSKELRMTYGYNNLVKGASKYVLVGDVGTIASSVDAVTWTKETSGINTRLHDVVYATDQYIAVGAYGVALTSADATEWELQDTETEAFLRSAAVLGSTIVTVGDDGVILTSTDAISWIQQTSGTTKDLYTVTLQGSNLYAAGEDGILLSSTDAVTWTPIATGITREIQGLAYNGSSKYVAVSAATVKYASPEGSNSYPYDTLETACTSLNKIAEDANPGDRILVDQGIYTRKPSEVSVLRIEKHNLIVKSIYGAEQTILDGELQGRVVSISCGYTERQTEMNNLFDGFTIKNGIAFTGAGIKVGNSVDYYGNYNVIQNCIVTENKQDTSVMPIAGYGAGIAILGKTIVRDCEISYNVARDAGGGVYEHSGTNSEDLTLIRSKLHHNSSANEGSAVISNGIIKDCLIYRNFGAASVVASDRQKHGDDIPVSKLLIDNCTIVNNSCATGSGINNSSAAVLAKTVRNSIVYGNTGAQDNWIKKYYDKDKVHSNIDFSLSSLTNVCTENSKLPGNGMTITNPVHLPPLFVDEANDDYRLATNSPCINAGVNWAGSHLGNPKSILFDFGPNTTTGNWNNITSVDNGEKITNAIDENGDPTTIDLWLEESDDTNPVSWVGTIIGGPDHTATEYPSTAQGDAIVSALRGILAKSLHVRLKGLNPDAYYDMKVFASASTDDYDTMHSIQDVNTQVMSVNNTDAGPSQWLDVEIDAGNEVLIESVGWTSSKYAAIGVLEVIETAMIADLSPLWGSLDINKQPRIYLGSPVDDFVDIGAYEFQADADSSNPPTAALTKDSETRINKNIQFDATASTDDVGVVSYSWDYDGGVKQSGTDAEPFVTWTEKGLKTVSLTVTDATGLTDSTSVSFEVSGSTPNDPTLLNITSGTGIPVALSWSDNSSDETGFIIQRKSHKFVPIEVVL